MFIKAIFEGFREIIALNNKMFGDSMKIISPNYYAFFLSFLLHGINIWTISRIVFYQIFFKQLPLVIPLILSSAVFIFGFLFFFRKYETYKIKEYHPLWIAFSVIYAIATVLTMILVSNFLRDNN